MSNTIDGTDSINSSTVLSSMGRWMSRPTANPPTSIVPNSILLINHRTLAGILRRRGLMGMVIRLCLAGFETRSSDTKLNKTFWQLLTEVKPLVVAQLNAVKRQANAFH